MRLLEQNNGNSSAGFSGYKEAPNWSRRVSCFQTCLSEPSQSGIVHLQMFQEFNYSSMASSEKIGGASKFEVSEDGVTDALNAQ